MISGLGVNGGSTFGGTPMRHNMFGCRQAGHLHLGMKHVHGKSHDEVVLYGVWSLWDLTFLM